MLYNLGNILAQSDADQLVARYVWTMTISVKSHTPVICVCGRCTEVWRGTVAAPRITLLVAAARVTRNEKAREEGRVTDQKLIGVSIIYAHAIPQSIRACNIPIIVSGRYGHLGAPFEVDFLSGLVINEHYFRELQDKLKYVHVNISVSEEISDRFIFVKYTCYLKFQLYFTVSSMTYLYLATCLLFTKLH